MQSIVGCADIQNSSQRIQKSSVGFAAAMTETGGDDVSQRNQAIGAQQTHSAVATVCDDYDAQRIDAHVNRITELVEVVACTGTLREYDGTSGIKPTDSMITCVAPALHAAIRLQIQPSVKAWSMQLSTGCLKQQLAVTNTTLSTKDGKNSQQLQ
jgi:hypothetical protein